MKSGENRFSHPLSSSQAPYDLDNLRLADIPEGTQVSAHFDLEAIMLTGSCIDVTQGGNRGVSVGREHKSDTANSSDYLPLSFFVLL